MHKKEQHNEMARGEGWRLTIGYSCAGKRVVRGEVKVGRNPVLVLGFLHFSPPRRPLLPLLPLLPFLPLLPLLPSLQIVVHRCLCGGESCCATSCTTRPIQQHSRHRRKLVVEVTSTAFEIQDGGNRFLSFHVCHVELPCNGAGHLHE
jgi:hypothetical protein